VQAVRKVEKTGPCWRKEMCLRLAGLGHDKGNREEKGNQPSAGV
jgi:hypothetical protein